MTQLEECPGIWSWPPPPHIIVVITLITLMTKSCGRLRGAEGVDMGDILVIISLIKIAMSITDIMATWITLTSGRYGSGGGLGVAQGDLGGTCDVTSLVPHPPTCALLHSPECSHSRKPVAI